jgi:hypothetical protein
VIRLIKLHGRVKMNALSSTPRTGRSWSFSLTKHLMRFGVDTAVLTATAVIVALSVLITSTALSLFQGYIDFLGICICIAAPLLIFPLPARLFFSMFLKLQKTEEDLRTRNLELEKALDEVKTLSGFLPICCSCKNIRDDEGYWNDIEEYISDHSDLQLTHSICPKCVEHLYPELEIQPGKLKN